MWSGKMSTVVSPHNMLYTVWNNIPFFRGYSQQDAQEFLSYAVFTFSFLNLFLDLNFHSRFLRVVKVVSEIVLFEDDVYYGQWAASK